MPLYCPRDASELQKIFLDAWLPTAAAAHQCASCGGALLDVEAQRAVLGTGLSASDNGSLGRLSCPQCLDAMTQLPAGPVNVARCGACGHLWFDTGQLVVVRALVRQLQKTTDAGEPASASCPSPLDELELRCSDCDAPIDDHTEVVDLPAGIVCRACQVRPGFGAVRPGPGSNNYEHLGGAVLATHVADGFGYRGFVRLQNRFDGTLDARLKPLSVWGRLRRFWGQDVDLGDARLAAVFEVHARTPLRLQEFLRARGVAELLLDLQGHGEVDVRWTARRLEVGLRCTANADRAAVLLENAARRLHNAYRRFCA